MRKDAVFTNELKDTYKEADDPYGYDMVNSRGLLTERQKNKRFTGIEKAYWKNAGAIVQSVQKQIKAAHPTGITEDNKISNNKKQSDFQHIQDFIKKAPAPFRPNKRGHLEFSTPSIERGNFKTVELYKTSDQGNYKDHYGVIFYSPKKIFQGRQGDIEAEVNVLYPLQILFPKDKSKPLTMLFIMANGTEKKIDSKSDPRRFNDALRYIKQYIPDELMNNSETKKFFDDLLRDRPTD